MKNRNSKDEANREKSDGSKSINKKKNGMKKNMRRLGGQGLSLEAFANAKSKNSSYFNPALIKKQQEFYKNAKYVNKYKKSLKQQQSDLPSASTPLEEENETEDGSKMSKNNKRKRHGTRNLVELYEKKHAEEEKARMEREAIIQAKKEEREKSEARRKALREKFLKKTHKGQPLMKYRIEHLLETLQGSTK